MKENSVIRLTVSRRMTILGLLLFSLLMSLAFFSLFKNTGPSEHEEPGTDYSTRYKPMVLEIIKGNGIPLGENIGAPGYSIFLVPIFLLSHLSGIPEISLTMFFNAILLSLTTLVLFFVAKEVFDKNIAFIASLLWASYPLNLWFLKNPHTEVPFFLFFLLAVLFYLCGIKRKEASLFFIGGILLGLATLIRPVTFYLPILLFFMIFFLMSRKALRERNAFFNSFWNAKILRLAMVFLLGSILTMTPWIGYIYRTTGQFVPISTIGIDTLTTGLSYAFIGDGSRQTKVPEDVRSFMERVRGKTLLTNGDVIRFTLKEFTINPIPLIKLFGLKIVRSWYATTAMWWETQIALLQIPYLLIGLAGIVASFRKYKNHTFLALFLALIAYFWLVSILTVSIIRYTMPAMIFIMVFSAVIIQMALNKFKKLSFQIE